MTWLIRLGAIAGITAFATFLFTRLPDASLYPLPSVVTSSILGLYAWLYSLNNIFPIDTLATVAGWGVLIWLITRILFPAIMWIISFITSVR